MLLKRIKSSIAIVTALTFLLIPDTAVYAKTMNDTALHQVTVGTAAADTAATAVNYDDAKAVAEKKATVLTSLYGASSIQYALIDNGNIVLSGQAGVYSKESGTVPTADNMYGIGSISKVFTTVAVMQLVEQGKVNLETPVADYIPEFTMADPRYKDITVRMLLNHSSGLMGSTFRNSILFGDNDMTSYNNFLNSLKTSRLKADPGAFSVYCNDGFTLAQILVEKVSGKSFTDYIKDNISGPLGITHTKTPQDTFDRNNLVKAYLPSIKNTLPSEALNMIGAGGIYSSAEDLCHFAQLFMEQSNSKVLSADSTKAMENPEYKNGIWPGDDDTLLAYGLGWDNVNTYPFDSYGIKAMVKGGDTTVYHGSLIVLPDENMAMAVLTSGGASTYDQVMAQEVLLSALKAKGSISEITPDKTFTKPVKVPLPADLKKFEGIYASAFSVSKVSLSDDGTLTISNVSEESSSTMKYFYTGDGKFYYPDGSGYLSFREESKNGNTYLYSSGYSQLPSIGQYANSGYIAQKLTANPLAENVKKAWENRENKKYFLISEKYSSSSYASSTPYTESVMLKDLEGYVGNSKIIDENNVENLVQIPGLLGRDLSDGTFYCKGKTEYLSSNQSVFISEDAIKNLSAKSSFTAKIGSDGYAVWYKISKKSAGKKLKVTIPKNAAFVVYNSKDTCINNSYFSKKTTVTLPSKGYIVLVGDSNAKFAAKYVK